jgi:hypothetical protein
MNAETRFFIFDLPGGFGKEILNQESQRGICPKLEECVYVSDRINDLDLKTNEAIRYLVNICTDFYNACELNQQERS